MGIVLVIAVIALVIFLIIIAIKYHIFKKYLLKNFKSNNSGVFGKVGKGKDVLFQYVINHQKDFYYANIDYGGKHKIITLADCTVSPNTYENFINGQYEKIKRTFYEGKHFYFSDIGNIAPAQYDSLLHKKYPSLPIFQSLIRHLYNSHFHWNAQTLERPWKPIREQSEFFVWCRGTVKIIGLFFVVHVTTYEKYESAKQLLFPLKKTHFNKYAKADYQRYYAVNGDIRNGFIIIPRWKLKYNTRAFEKLLLRGKRKYYKK